MAVEWRLQDLMQANGIRNASQLELALLNKLGVRISRVALDKLLKKEPVQFRLETAQYLCTLLQVPLDCLLSITPEALIKPPVIVQPFVRQAQPSQALMVDPGQFF